MTPVCKVSELTPGSMKTVNVSGKRIAVANIDGQYFAIDDACSHVGCSLGSEGFLDGTTVTCGCHGAQFDITNGKVLALPAVSDVSSYEVTVEGDMVSVAV
ncbi:non-heme iron oxygenase ferredoxin subunit [Candidatus Gottesmanbacteria bacterium]|nr:non-heme iron oxygenase ferredoxin subunit [Candidatus Gottesmanbacteria bacterium]